MNAQNPTILKPGPWKGQRVQPLKVLSLQASVASSQLSTCLALELTRRPASTWTAAWSLALCPLAREWKTPSSSSSVTEFCSREVFQDSAMGEEEYKAPNRGTQKGGIKSNDRKG